MAKKKDKEEDVLTTQNAEDQDADTGGTDEDVQPQDNETETADAGADSGTGEGPVEAEVAEADSAGVHAAPDANEDAKAEARDMAATEPGNMMLAMPQINYLRAALVYLAGMLGSNSEFEEFKQNFPALFE